MLGSGFSSGSVTTGKVAQEDSVHYMLIQKPKNPSPLKPEKNTLITASDGFDISEHLEDVQWSSDSDEVTEISDGFLKPNQYGLSQLISKDAGLMEIVNILEEGMGEDETEKVTVQEKVAYKSGVAQEKSVGKSGAPQERVAGKIVAAPENVSETNGIVQETIAEKSGAPQEKVADKSRATKEKFAVECGECSDMTTEDASGFKDETEHVLVEEDFRQVVNNSVEKTKSEIGESGAVKMDKMSLESDFREIERVLEDVACTETLLVKDVKTETQKEIEDKELHETIETKTEDTNADNLILDVEEVAVVEKTNKIKENIDEFSLKFDDSCNSKPVEEIIDSYSCKTEEKAEVGKESKENLKEESIVDKLPVKQNETEKILDVRKQILNLLKEQTMKHSPGIKTLAISSINENEENLDDRVGEISETVMEGIATKNSSNIMPQNKNFESRSSSSELFLSSLAEPSPKKVDESIRYSHLSEENLLRLPLPAAQEHPQETVLSKKPDHQNIHSELEPQQLEETVEKMQDSSDEDDFLEVEPLQEVHNDNNERRHSSDEDLEMQQMTEEEMKNMHKSLGEERDALIGEKGRQQRLAQSVTDQMCADAQVSIEIVRSIL